jgi:hypothetical protein
VIAKVKEYYRGRKKIQASNYWLARFNILMAFLFIGIAWGRALRKRFLPNVPVGFIFNPFLKRVARLNRVGNRVINAKSGG